MVDVIKTYKQKNGNSILKVYCKPIISVDDELNYFYADEEAVDLIQSFPWRLHNNRNTRYVAAKNKDRKEIELHKMYFDYDNQHVIDHVNGSGFDNVSENIALTDFTGNAQNRFCKGYSVESPIPENSRYYFAFRARYNINNHRKYDTLLYREDEACIRQNELENIYYQNRFNILLDRRNMEHLLDLERTGIISTEEAIYNKALTIADNAWYYLRYGLQDYFKDNHIQEPKYKIDDNGFMVHPITGVKLCPFEFNIKGA